MTDRAVRWAWLALLSAGGLAGAFGVAAGAWHVAGLAALANLTLLAAGTGSYPED